jgi:hypothetical protein
VGVTVRDLGVLRIIARGEAQSQEEAAAVLGVDGTSMVALLDALERQGIVARRPSEQDRRPAMPPELAPVRSVPSMVIVVNSVLLGRRRGYWTIPNTAPPASISAAAACRSSTASLRWSHAGKRSHLARAGSRDRHPAGSNPRADRRPDRRLGPAATADDLAILPELAGPEGYLAWAYPGFAWGCLRCARGLGGGARGYVLLPGCSRPSSPFDDRF